MLDLGKPRGASRPAWARSPTQSLNSDIGSVKVRPAGSSQDRPSAFLNTRTSRQAAVLVALQAHALAARHLVHLLQREDQHLAVLADDGDQCRPRPARSSRPPPARRRSCTCLPLRVMATISSSGTTKPWPEVAAMSSLRPGSCTKISTNVVVLLQVDHQAHRLAVAAAARQLVGRQREHLAVGGEQQQLVGRLRLDGAHAARRPA